MKDLSKIKLLVMDVDGVLTDGMLTYGRKLKSLRSFNVRDGLGINLLHANNVHIAIISGGTNEAIKERAKDLNIKYVFTKVKNKSNRLLLIQRKLNISKSETIYVGDDINDLPVKTFVRFLISPKNAHKYFKKNADIVLNSNGGEGAIRELADKILADKSITLKAQIDSII